jgi:pimeloyl-ACP methyl ester carboxylesterase
MELSVPVEGGHLWADDTGGDGPVIVLLHPGWGDSSIWLPVLDRLPGSYRVIQRRRRHGYRAGARRPGPHPGAPAAEVRPEYARIGPRTLGEARYAERHPVGGFRGG